MKDLRKFGSRLQGHPVRYSKLLEHHSVPGVEYSGGSEGIGLSVSIGIALANVIDNKDNNVYVLLGDGETNEGQVWEAAMAAAHYKLDNLTVIVDNNGLQIDSKSGERHSPFEKDDRFYWSRHFCGKWHP